MEERSSWETITIYFDGKPLQVPSGISIKEALQLSGFTLSPLPKGDGIFVPCEVGGCMSCAMEVDGVSLPILFHPFESFMDFKGIQLGEWGHHGI